MIFYHYPFGYRRSWFWLPGLSLAASACWLVFVVPLLLLFWAVVWCYAGIAWLIAEFYLLVATAACMCIWQARGREFHVELRRLRFGLWLFAAVPEPPPPADLHTRPLHPVSTWRV